MPRVRAQLENAVFAPDCWRHAAPSCCGIAGAHMRSLLHLHAVAFARNLSDHSITSTSDRHLGMSLSTPSCRSILQGGDMLAKRCRRSRSSRSCQIQAHCRTQASSPAPWAARPSTPRKRPPGDRKVAAPAAIAGAVGYNVIKALGNDLQAQQSLLKLH